MTGQNTSRILDEALTLYHRAVELQTEGKSWTWETDFIKLYWNKINESLDALINYAQEEPHISFSQPVTSRDFGFIAEEMITYLKTHGLNLAKIPHQLCESKICSRKIGFNYMGRLLSTDLLYRLAIVNSINSRVKIKNINTILEIGAGLGNLARCLKIYNPKLKYYIVDLPETLLFSYCFLKVNFPNAVIKYILSPEELFDHNKGSFIFIPSSLVTRIPKLLIDLVINTHSFGEMPQKNVLDYMDLIQEKLEVKFLYSLNRYLEDYRAHQTGIVSLPLDRHWKTRKWTFGPQFTRIDRASIPVDLHSTLEVLMERIPQNKRDKLNYKTLSEKSFEEANRQNIKGYDWHRAMFESIRLNPTINNLRIYVKFLGDAECREYFFYRDLLVQLGGEIPPLNSKSEKLFNSTTN